MWFKCLCIIIALAISISVIYITSISQKENYKLMRNLGKFPENIGIIKSLRHPDDDEDEISQKYRGHRYERQKVRYHAPNKIYQQTQG